MKLIRPLKFLAVFVGSLSISAHGNEGVAKVWTGPVLSIATLAAVAAESAPAVTE